MKDYNWYDGYADGGSDGRYAFNSSNLIVRFASGPLDVTIDEKLGRIRSAASQLDQFCNGDGLGQILRTASEVAVSGLISRPQEGWMPIPQDKWNDAIGREAEEISETGMSLEFIRKWQFDEMLDVLLPLVSQQPVSNRDILRSYPITTIYGKCPMGYDPLTNEFHWNIPPKDHTPSPNSGLWRKSSAGPKVERLFEAWWLEHNFGRYQDGENIVDPLNKDIYAIAIAEVQNPCETRYMGATNMVGDFGQRPNIAASWTGQGYIALLEDGSLKTTDSLPDSPGSIPVQALRYALDMEAKA